MTSTLEKLRASKWSALLWIVPVAAIVLVAVVLGAQWMRTQPWMQDFLADYPGESQRPEGAPVGFPAWLSWAHFFNAFLIVLIIKSGWQVRTVKRPAAYWTRGDSLLFRTYGARKKISLDQWFHLTLDGLWVLNGVIFVVLLFITGHWMRIVPLSWDVIPNALSAVVQYASLDWPLENGWVNYNALQLLAYFVTVFIAAPLAALTGLRMSPAWPKDAAVNRILPIEWARALHFPIMLYFVLFIVAHVTLVLTTGALRNLNHMYAGQDDDTSWLGFWIFLASIVVMAAAWIASRPIILRPIAQLTGTVTRS